MTLPADVLVGDHPLAGCSSGPTCSPEVQSRTAAGLDAMEAAQELQVEEVAYRPTLQALDRPLVASLRRLLG